MTETSCVAFESAKSIYLAFMHPSLRLSLDRPEEMRIFNFISNNAINKALLIYLIVMFLSFLLSSFMPFRVT